MPRKLFSTIDALQSLRPGTEATIDSDDYKTVKFLKSIENPPTEAEILAEVERLNFAYEENQKNINAQKIALLERLGITKEEAKLLLS